MDFEDRVDAGRQLAQRLAPLSGQNVVVLGLPRGGVPVAYEVADALEAPLDVIVVRKLGVPVHPELAMGAIGEEGARILDERIMGHFQVTPAELEAVEHRERAVLQDRTAQFRQGRERVDLAGRTAVVVDDGMATGATARVACRIARQLGAARVVLAVPVSSREAAARAEEADEIVVLDTPPDFQAVGVHYRDFSATQDEEVVALLDTAVSRHQGPSRTAGDDVPGAAVVAEDVQIPAGDTVLEGHLHLPATDAAVVALIQQPGNGPRSRGAQHVASALQHAGVGTLLVDLSTAEEAGREEALGVPVLAQRVTAATAWVHQQPHSMSSPVGYFGSGTGAGAALWAAAEPGARVGAIVSCGEVPELAGDRLAGVHARTLLVVGGRNREALDSNRRAREALRCGNRLAVIEEAAYPFEEPETVQAAVDLARDWFTTHLTPTDDDTTEVPR